MRLGPGTESPIDQDSAGCRSRPMRVIGVTGIHGKTTVSSLLASVLHAAGWAVGVLGSLGCLDGRDVVHPARIPPPADELASLLARMAAHHCSHAIVELPLEEAAHCWPTGAELDVVCVTCLSSCGLQAGAAPRADNGKRPVLLEHLAPEGLAVLSADDPGCAQCLGQIEGPVLTVGIHSPAEITARLLEQSPGGQTFLLVAGNEVMPVSTRRIGAHQVINSLLAAAVGLAYGIDLPTVVRGLEAVDYVPGRLEPVACGQPFSVFVDHARSPEGLAACLAALREVVPGRLICVVGAEADLEPSDRRRLGRAVEEGAELAIVTSGRRRAMDRRTAIDEVLGGFRHPEQAEVVLRRREAIALALDRAVPGDAVLVLGDEVELIRSRLYRGRPGILPQHPTPMCASYPLP